MRSSKGGITDDNLWRPARRAEERYTKDKLPTRRGAVHSIGWLSRLPVPPQINVRSFPGRGYSGSLDHEFIIRYESGHSTIVRTVEPKLDRSRRFLGPSTVLVQFPDDSRRLSRWFVYQHCPGYCSSVRIQGQLKAECAGKILLRCCGTRHPSPNEWRCHGCWRRLPDE